MAKNLIAGFLILLMTAGSVGAVIILPDGPTEDWKKSGSQKSFVGQRLFDHINGGAELYHEFGFERLSVQNYMSGDEEITVELYEMDSPMGALGIYLAQVGSETPVEGLKARNSGSKYQLSVATGEAFFQVNNFSGAEEFVPLMTGMAQSVLKLLPEAEPIEAFNLLPEKDLITGTERLIRGQYALQSIFTFGEGDILSLGGKIFGVVGDYSIGKDDVYTRIIVDYPDPDAAKAAFTHLTKNLDSHLEMLAGDESHFTFKDYRDRFGKVTVDGQVVELLVRLPEPPSE